MLNKTQALRTLNTAPLATVNVQGRVAIRRDKDGSYAVSDGCYTSGEGMGLTCEYRYVSWRKEFAEAYKEAVLFINGEHWRNNN